MYVARASLARNIRVGYMGMLANILKRFLSEAYCESLFCGCIGGTLASCEVLELVYVPRGCPLCMSLVYVPCVCPLCIMVEDVTMTRSRSRTKPS